MHIDATSHEHGASGRVFEYEADYTVDPGAITWEATIRPVGQPPRRVSGTIVVTTPALATLADEAVRDEILKRIDTFDDGLADPPVRPPGG